VFNTCFTTQGSIRSATDHAKADPALQGRFLVELQERGVRPTARGTWFVSAAHDPATIEETVAAADAALGALAGS
jgi:glutamate-1-semialdehyde aminotransferase